MFYDGVSLSGASTIAVSSAVMLWMDKSEMLHALLLTEAKDNKAAGVRRCSHRIFHENTLFFVLATLKSTQR